MPDLSGLGDLVLTVGGDISPLTDALSEIPSVASDAARQIQTAFDAIPSATQDVETSLSNLSTGLQEAGSAAGQAASGAEQIPPALHDTSEAAGEAGAKLKEFVTAGLELAGIAISLEAIKGAVEEMVGSFDQLERASISLTALTGSAEEAQTTLEGLKQFAVSDALSFPALIQAQQRMTAFGVSATQVRPLMQAAADAAGAMGIGFDRAVTVLDRMAVSGMVAARQLTQIGLTTHDLADAMGVADSAVTATFKAMDQSDRVDVLIAAMQKFDGVAAALAESLSGQWTSFKNQVEFALEGVGEVFDTVLKGVVKTAQDSVVPGIEAMVGAFKDMSAVAGPLVGGVLKDLTQGFGDLATVTGGTVSGIINITSQLGHFKDVSAEIPTTWKEVVDDVNLVNPWNQAATAINLASGSTKMFAQDSQIMSQRMKDATQAAQDLVDKQAELARGGDITATATYNIQQAIEKLKSSYVDLVAAEVQDKTNLSIITDLYNTHRATLLQVVDAQKQLWAAQDALNGLSGQTHTSVQTIQLDYNNLKAALDNAQKNIDLVSQAYINGKASLEQYQAAVNNLATAQKNFTGSLPVTPLQQVNDALTKLQQNYDNAKAYLDAVIEKMKTNSDAAVLLAGAQKGVADAAKAMGDNSVQSASNMASSAPKLTVVKDALDGVAGKYIEVANAAQYAAAQQAAWATGFVGPVQAATEKIQVFGGAASAAGSSSKTLQNGVEVLRGSVQGLTTDAKSAGDAAVYMGDHWQSAAATVANAAKTIVSAANQEHDAVVQASQDAMQNVQSLSDQLDQAMAGPSEGGGTLGMHLSLTPGEQITAPSNFFTPPRPAEQIGVGMGGGVWGAQNTMTYGTPAEIIAYAQSLQQFAQGLNTATPSVTSAATALTTAATTQQDAAQAAYDAAKAATIGTTNTTTALTTAADQISASALAAADAANTAAFNNAGLTSIITGTASVVQQAATIAAASTTLVSTALVALGQPAITPGGSNTFTMNAPVVGALPSLGPSGGMTAGLRPGAYTPAYQGSLTPQTPVNINVNGSQFVQQLMNEFIQQLGNQGLIIRRG